MDKRFLASLGVIAVILIGIFFVTTNHSTSMPTGSSKGQLTNHVEGAGSSGVTLTEYGDFQCPACAQYYPALQQVVSQYSESIHFQFRNFPLFQVHPNAIAAARAAEAADLQGAYWKMHDKLYTESINYYTAQSQGKSYPSWVPETSPSDTFVNYAKGLGLDSAKFKADYASSRINDRIQADLKAGTKLGVASTPTFFLDGKKISNPDASLEAFSKVLNAEITKKGGTPPTATPAAATSPAVAQ